MQNLKFNQLSILSNSEKSGNVFQFKHHLNLITAGENNVGKSTIVKLLFWTLGCDLAFDTTWSNLDCKTIIKFQAGNSKFEVMRYKNLISLKGEGLKRSNYSKITGEYAQTFSTIVDFKALLPNRNEEDLDVPPPAYYFLPYYIDQKKSWTKPWDAFENLGQYENWKQPIIKYHVGLLTPRHFEIESERYLKKHSQKLITDDIKKLDTTLTIVARHVPKLSAAVTVDDQKFNLMTEEIRSDLMVLASEQEVLLDDFAKCQSEKAYLEHQQVIAEGVIRELELDYQFTVENLEADDIECPICGTMHQNTAVDRASILVDKQQSENQLANTTNQIEKLKNRLAKINSNLEITRDKIDFLNSKYSVEDSQQEKASLNTIIESIAGKSIQDKILVDRSEKLVEHADLGEKIKKLNKEQKDLQSKEFMDEIINFFQEIFIKYAKLLQTEEVNLSAINSPLDYNKVVKEGGAAENVRVTLAYNLAVYSTVEKYGSGMKSAFVLDTPNQHEQSDTNYESIINLILESFSKDAQIILCAMDNEHLAKYKEKAHIITLSDNKLLDKNKYDQVKIEFDKF